MHFSGKDTNEFCESLIAKLQGAIKQEHSIGISHIGLLRPKTIPKTTSGKIARAWCRKAFLSNTLQSVYMKSFETSSNDAAAVEGNKSTANMKPLEMEHPLTTPSIAITEDVDANDIRSMDRSLILDKLIAEIATLGSIPPETIDRDAPLVTLIDSISISQFKGLLEHQYTTKLSDEYLFGERTCVNKLVEVVKLGYAPDDTKEEGRNNDANEEGELEGLPYTPKANGGLAGCLGCPPGVYCTIM